MVESKPSDMGPALRSMNLQMQIGKKTPVIFNEFIPKNDSTPLLKGVASSKPSFLVSILDFQGVYRYIVYMNHLLYD